MEEVCNLDLFKHCVTTASACNQVFQQEFWKDNTISLNPAEGYQPTLKYYVMALQFIIRKVTKFCTL